MISNTHSAMKKREQIQSISAPRTATYNPPLVKIIVGPGAANAAIFLRRLVSGAVCLRLPSLSLS